jgi:hypothetical protein
MSVKDFTNQLIDDDKREINQLWFVALYFSLIKKIEIKLPNDIFKETLKSIADKSIKQSIFHGILRRIRIFLAHLDSCAIRLNTVDEILNKYGRSRIKW